MNNEPTGANAQLTEGLDPLPAAVRYRTRYRSEPGMVGHYPWTYADHSRRRRDRPECEYENLYTAAQVHAAVAAEHARIVKRLRDEATYSCPCVDDANLTNELADILVAEGVGRPNV